VGFGIVASEVVLAKDFPLPNGRVLADADLEDRGVLYAPANPDDAEYAIGVDWHKTFPLPEAKRLKGGFFNQRIVCKLRHQKILDFLFQVFEGSGEAH
jgi:hypothetical protein